MKYNDLELAI